MVSAFLTGVLSLLVVAHGEEWREDLPPLPVGRQEAGIATLERKIYVIGGIDANRAATGRVSRFNVDENLWEDVDSLPDDSRLHHVGAAAAAGKVYAVGGLTSSFNGVGTVYCYDPVAEQWSRVADMPTERGAMGVAAIGERVYAAGGQRGAMTVNEFAVYHTD